MRICILEGDMSRKGGTERMAALLANALCAEHQVWILSLQLQGNAVFFELNTKVRHLVLPPAKGKLGILSHMVKIRNFIKSNHIERVINVDTGMGIYGILAAAGTKAKVITWEHANYFNNWNSRLFPYIRRFAARHSRAVVVLTQQDKENYTKHISGCAPVHVIPNPASAHAFAYNIESKIILSAGLLVPIKRYDRVVELAKRLLPSRPEWTWIICGEGPEREHLEAVITEANLTGRVHLPGVVRDMDQQYRNAGLFVMTSEMEGLPMVLLEAKSHGLPLVSFDIQTGPQDIIADGVNGCLATPYDLDEMEEKIRALMDNDALRQQYSAQSQLWMDKFAWPKIIGLWQELLERM